MSSEMTIVQSIEKARVPVTVLHITGEINTNSSRQLQTQADAAYAAGARDMILDLKNVPYMSSGGLRALHHIFTILRADTPQESSEAMSKGLRDGTFKSPHLKLVSPNSTVHEVLKVSGFDMYLEIHRTLKDALASF
jgi:anti-anti-sigma factor